MAFGLTILAVVWLTGWVMDVAPRRRLMAMAALWALILLATVALPFDHGLRQRLGGDARPWLILGGLAGLVLAYRAGLQAIRARVRPVPVWSAAGVATRRCRRAAHGPSAATSVA